MSSPVRLALVGCGSLGRQVHLPILASLPGTRLVAIADPDARALASAEQLAPSAARFADHRELITRDDVDVVAAATDAAAEGRRVSIGARARRGGAAIPGR